MSDSSTFELNSDFSVPPASDIEALGLDSASAAQLQAHLVMIASQKIDGRDFQDWLQDNVSDYGENPVGALKGAGIDTRGIEQFIASVEKSGTASRNAIEQEIFRVVLGISGSFFQAPIEAVLTTPPPGWVWAQDPTAQEGLSLQNDSYDLNYEDQVVSSQVDVTFTNHGVPSANFSDDNQISIVYPIVSSATLPSNLEALGNGEITLQLTFRTKEIASNGEMVFNLVADNSSVQVELNAIAEQFAPQIEQLEKDLADALNEELADFSFILPLNRLVDFYGQTTDRGEGLPLQLQTSSEHNQLAVAPGEPLPLPRGDRGLFPVVTEGDDATLSFANANVFELLKSELETVLDIESTEWAQGGNTWSITRKTHVPAFGDAKLKDFSLTIDDEGIGIYADFKGYEIDAPRKDVVCLTAKGILNIQLAFSVSDGAVYVDVSDTGCILKIRPTWWEWIVGLALGGAGWIVGSGISAVGAIVLGLGAIAGVTVVLAKPFQDTDSGQSALQSVFDALAASVELPENLQGEQRLAISAITSGDKNLSISFQAASQTTG